MRLHLAFGFVALPKDIAFRKKFHQIHSQQSAEKQQVTI